MNYTRATINHIQTELEFQFEAAISNTEIDSFHTKMGLSSLANFAEDAKNGVALLDSHTSTNLGYGRSSDGIMQDGVARATFPIIRGIKFGGSHSFAGTDDLITAIVGKAVADVSVGFREGKYICDICGEKTYGADCRHIPGLIYVIDKNQMTATATINDARLSEVSIVFDGATPGAMIEKIKKGVERGWVKISDIPTLEQRHKIKLNNRKTITIPEMVKGIEMKDETRDILKREGVEFETADDAIGELLKRIKALKPRAKDGDEYRQSIIKQACAEAVRFSGSDFNRELHENVFRTASLEYILDQRDGWRKMADEKNKGGRQTQPDIPNTDPDKNKKTNEINYSKI